MVEMRLTTDLTEGGCTGPHLNALMLRGDVLLSCLQLLQMCGQEAEQTKKSSSSALRGVKYNCSP